MAVWNDQKIKCYLSTLIKIDRSEWGVTAHTADSQVNPNSIDLTLSNTAYKPAMEPLCVCYGQNVSDEHYQRIDGVRTFVLQPNDVLLGCTREWVHMPDNACGQLFTKSTLGRFFVNHMMAGVVDAGFSGRLTLELKNDSPWTVIIPAGSRVVQLVISDLTDYAVAPYGDSRNSRYHGKSIALPPIGE